MITVVGAGMAGLSAALLAAREGQLVRVLERSSRVGGLAARHVFRGVSCDMGSHRLHAASLDVPLIAEMRDPCRFVTRPRRGVVRLGGRFVPYPPSMLGLMLGLGLARSVSLGFSLARRRGRMRWDHERLVPGDEDVGFEQFVCERAGEAAYEAFYRPYAEKVWGVSPSELSQTVAKSRLSTGSPLSALARLATHPRQEFLYPEGGIASMIDYLHDQLRAHDVHVELETSYEPDQAGSEPVLNSGGFEDWSGDFRHRGLYLVYLAVPVTRLREYETYYVPERQFWFGRVAEVANYSPRLSRPNESILVVEIPEGQWGDQERFDEGQRFTELIAQLREAEILPRGLEPVAAEQRFVPGVYPLYLRGWVPRWRSRIERIAAAGNVYPFGRQGLFVHCNLHHCGQMARDVVSHVTRGGDAKSWAGKVERYLSLTTAD